jgi:hypothetical protein
MVKFVVPEISVSVSDIQYVKGVTVTFNRQRAFELFIGCPFFGVF